MSKLTHKGAVLEVDRDDIVIEFDERKPTVNPHRKKDEVWESRNRTIFYHPLQQKMRGAFIPGRTPHDTARYSGSGRVAPPELPGMMLALNVRLRRLRVIEPIVHMLDQDKLTAELLASQNMQPTDGVEFNREGVRESLSDNQLATHWYWMKRHVDGQTATLVQGEFGERPNGRVIIHAGYKGPPYDPKTRTGIPRFQDEVDHFIGRSEAVDAG